MGYWKCSIGLYLSPIMRAVTKPIHAKDGFMPARESIFIKLLSYCADGYKFYDAKHFSKITMSPQKQCEIVWDTCIENNVLREAVDGYSTAEWMQERGYLPTPTARQKRPTAASDAEANNNTTEAAEPPQSETCAQETASAPNATPTTVDAEPATKMEAQTCVSFKPQVRITAPQNRVAVRPNIWLSDDEVRLLKQKYSDNDITYMVDYYSNWKRSKGEDIRISDYQAITRWVYRVLDKRKQPETSAAIAAMPDWVHGGTVNEQNRSGGAH